MVVSWALLVTFLQILVAVLFYQGVSQHFVFKFEDLSFLGDHVVHRTETCTELVVDKSEEEREGGEGGNSHLLITNKKPKLYLKK